MEVVKELLVIFLSSAFGHLFTRKAQAWNLSSVRASALAGTLAGILLQLGLTDGVLMVASFFGGSFVGMTDPHKFKLSGIFITTLIFSITYFFLRGLFEGSGGLLGFSAFIGVIIFHYFQKLKHIGKVKSHSET